MSERMIGARVSIPDYFIGVDLGQARDFTAIAVLERHKLRGVLDEKAALHYQLRHLERLPLGTSYPEQVEAVKGLWDKLRARIDSYERRPRVSLVVDQTGVGRPVVDMLREAGLRRLTAITITAGDAVSRDGFDVRVPKRELVSVMQVLLQSGRFQYAANLKLVPLLQKELLAFKVSISAQGHDSYNNDARENPHDDLVLAVALAAWVGESVAAPPTAAAIARLRGGGARW